MNFTKIKVFVISNLYHYYQIIIIIYYIYIWCDIITTLFSIPIGSKSDINAYNHNINIYPL